MHREIRDIGEAYAAIDNKGSISGAVDGNGIAL